MINKPTKGKAMKHWKTLTASALLLILGLTMSNSATAMTTQQRLAIIKGLKIKGVVGENNQGLLEFRGKPQAEEIVKQENLIRLNKYKKIAKKTNTPVMEVGQQRAKQITEQADPGTWLQSPEGKWYKKE